MVAWSLLVPARQSRVLAEFEHFLMRPIVSATVIISRASSDLVAPSSLYSFSLLVYTVSISSTQSESAL